MKYYYLLLCSILFLSSSAQLSIINLADDSVINDGDVFEFDALGEPAPTSTDGKLKFKISNTSSTETIRVLGEMTALSNTDGSSCQYCIQPLCFFNTFVGQIIPNNPVVLAPGEDNGVNDSFYNSDPGDDENYPIEYTLRFFMVDENEQEIGEDISITYSYTPETFSNREYTLEDLGVTLHNTLITESLNFDTNSNMSFKIYDLNARRLDVYNVNPGQHQYNMSDLSSGYYIIIFENPTGRQSQVRVQKR